MKRKKNGEYRACLKYSVPIFVEQIYKMPRLEVSGAVRPIYGSLGVKWLIKAEKPLSHKRLKSRLETPNYGRLPSSFLALSYRGFY